MHDEFLRQYFSLPAFSQSSIRNHFWSLNSRVASKAISQFVYDINFIWRSMILSLLKKFIFVFAPENYFYCYDLIWSRYFESNFYEFFVYREKFFVGTDILFSELDLRYNLTSVHESTEKINDYVDFLFELIDGLIQPVCITNLTSIMRQNLDDENFIAEFSKNPDSLSHLFFTRLKVKLHA
jgi:hypothetical protein